MQTQCWIYYLCCSLESYTCKQTIFNIGFMQPIQVYTVSQEKWKKQLMYYLRMQLRLPSQKGCPALAGNMLHCTTPVTGWHLSWWRQVKVRFLKKHIQHNAKTSRGFASWHHKGPSDHLASSDVLTESRWVHASVDFEVQASSLWQTQEHKTETIWVQVHVEHPLYKTTLHKMELHSRWSPMQYNGI